MPNYKRGTISKRLGIPLERPLTKSVCQKKVRILRKGIAEGKYDGKLLNYAKYYENWYRWKAQRLAPKVPEMGIAA